MLIVAQGAACRRILQGCCELCPSALGRNMAVAMAVLTTGIRSDLSIMRTDSIKQSDAVSRLFPLVHHSQDRQTLVTARSPF